MFKILLLIGCAALANGQSRVDYVDNSAPTPYQFSYTAPAEGGSSSHEETGDGNGRVTGSYTVQDDDGRQRIVQYVADEGGFRAAISTNEPGTSSQNPADVTIDSSADDGFEAGTRTLQTTPVAVAPVVPATPVVPVAVAPRPVPPIPARRQTLVPIQPALVPLQPTLIPVQPQFFDPRRFVAQPPLFPLDAGRFVAPPPLFPLDAGRFVPRFVPIGSRRFIDAPALVPIQNTRVIPDPFFRPYDREFLV